MKQLQTPIQIIETGAMLESFSNPLPHQILNLSYTASGYGKKIPTSYMVKHENRLKRVYCMVYSNLGTLYILSKGQRIIVH